MFDWVLNRTLNLNIKIISLLKKCPLFGAFLVRIFSHLERIWTRFTLCFSCDSSDNKELIANCKLKSHSQKLIEMLVTLLILQPSILIFLGIMDHSEMERNFSQLKKKKKKRQNQLCWGVPQKIWSRDFANE